MCVHSCIAACNKISSQYINYCAYVYNTIITIVMSALAVLIVCYWLLSIFCGVNTSSA